VTLIERQKAEKQAEQNKAGVLKSKKRASVVQKSETKGFSKGEKDLYRAVKGVKTQYE